jgi:ribosomal protein S20
MPISLSAKKSLRKSIKNRKVNVLFKVKLKKTIKNFLAKPSNDGLKEVYSVLDKAIKNNVFHKNKVARLKASYSKKIEGKNKTATKKKVTKKPVAKKTTKKSKKM